jgi:hypothetical protein
MNQIYYNYIQKRNEKIFQSILTENEIKDLNPGKLIYASILCSC